MIGAGKKYYYLFVITLIFIFPISSYGQINDSTIKSDSVVIMKNYYLVLRDTLILFEKDTILILPDTLQYLIKSQQTIKSQSFYDSLRSKATKNILTKELYNLTFSPSNKQSTPKKIKTEKSETQHLEHQSKIIRNIQIKKLEVFGPTVYDTSIVSESWLEKTGNNIHTNSKNRVIKNNLLFNKGEKVNPYKLADNERIIRQLPFIDDVRIIIVPDSSNNDSVDILVITKDVWSLGADLRVKNVNSAYGRLYEKNLAGFGHEINNKVIYNINKFPSLGYDGFYKIQNISRSFVTGIISYYNTYEKEEYFLGVSRGFITPYTKYAGGLSLKWINNTVDVNGLNTRKRAADLSYDHQDIWLGRSISFYSKDIRKFKRSKAIVSARMIRKQFNKRPYTDVDSNIAYHNTTMFLGSVAFSERKYYRSNLIFNFGRTEDIPYGYLLAFTAGHELLEYSERVYTGIKLAKGNDFHNIGYYYLSIMYGSYLRNALVEQGVFEIEANTFSKLYVRKKFKHRHFIKINYLFGINRKANEKITINNGSGIRDFNSEMVEGDKRFTMTFESVCFTNYEIFGFKFAIYGFADIGVVGLDKYFLFENRYYSGFGIGLRIRNENLIFKTIQIGLTYYPEIPPHNNICLFNIGNEKKINLKDFDSQAPSVIVFE